MVRLSKTSVYFKNKYYQIEVNGQSSGIIDYNNHKLEYDVDCGKTIIEIVDGSGLKNIDVNIKPGQSYIITINPSASQDLIRGIFIGFSLVAITVLLFVDPKPSATWFITLFPLLLFWNMKKESKFELTAKRFMV